MRIFSLLKNDPEKELMFEKLLEKRREEIEMRMLSMDPQIFERLKARRTEHAEALKKSDPEAYNILLSHRAEYIKRLEKTHPELAEKYKEVFGVEGENNKE